MANQSDAMRKETEMMRSVFRWWQDIEMGWNLVVQVRMGRTKRLGVYVVKAVATDHTKVPEGEQVASYAVEWPNSQIQTLAGCLLSALMQLDRLVGEWALDQQKPLRDP